MNQTYIVKSGDTLYGISNQYGVSVTDLMNLNNLKTTTLQINQELLIPSTTGTNPSTTFLYTVKKGDSLYAIAKKYNTTVAKIVALNNLKSNSLSIGQKLKIPETYSLDNEVTLPNFINYTVKKGDSLYSIAKSNGISVDTIIKDNALSSNLLSIGQNLKIRVNPETSGEVLECFGEDYTPPEATNTINYVVKKGDSLYKIASKYNTSITAIMNLNNLTSNNLSIGQVLKIPSATSSTTTTYTVKKGDSLWSIASKYNTTVDALKKKNNLTSNVLSIGQKLFI